MDINELEVTILRLKEELKHCKNQKAYRDKKKFYDRLCKERSDYYKFRKQKQEVLATTL